MNAQNNTETRPRKIGRPFPKGVSGNPGGRPKNDFAQMIAQKAFEKDPEKVLAAFFKQLAKGNGKVFTALADRAYGRLPQPVEHSGADGGPLRVLVEHIGSKDQATTKTE